MIFTENNVVFNLPSSYVEVNGKKVWGYVPNIETHTFLEWEGYFFCLERNDENIMLISDIAAGFRIYYIECRSRLYFSSSYSYLMDVLKANGIGLKLDNEMFLYWKKFGYTLGNKTIYEQIKKMPPAYKFVISPDGIIKSKLCYFSDVQNERNGKVHKLFSFDSLYHNLLTIYAKNKECPVILLYSGGVDSTLLAKILQELQIPYIAIIMKLYPETRDNCLDFERARINIKKCGAAIVDIVEINLVNGFNNNSALILSDLLFDRHLAVPFYEVMNFIANKYGRDSVVICGQGADSIFSFGPSDYNWSSFVKRCILYGNNLVRCIFQPIVCKELGFKYKVVLNQSQKLLAFCDHCRYIYAFDRDMPYLHSLQELISNVNGYILNERALYMYLKLFTYLQGSDNQVVIKSANSFGIKKIVLPYVSKKIIDATVRYKDNLKEIFDPKYVVRDILKHRYVFNSHYNQYRGRVIYQQLDKNALSDILALQKKLNKLFENRVKYYL